MVAVVVLVDEKRTTIPAIKKWTASKVPMYMLPAVWKVVPEIPRNVMGKVNKKELIKQMSI